MEPHGMSAPAAPWQALVRRKEGQQVHGKLLKMARLLGRRQRRRQRRWWGQGGFRGIRPSYPAAARPTRPKKAAPSCRRLASGRVAGGRVRA